MTGTSTITPTILAAREQEFPLLREYTYLNAASQGPLPNRTVQAIQQVATAAQFPNTSHARALPNYEQEARERLARLIGADPGDLVFTGNTTHGMNICAQGIDWRPGDNVVIPGRDFPSLSYAWYHLTKRGVEVRQVPFAGAGPTADELLAAADNRTRAIACSAITWDTGWQADMEELGRRCHERGILLILDGIQAVAARRLDVKALRISALATHGYKWLLAGFGVGALYVAPEAIDRINPTFIGEQAVDAPASTFAGNLNWKPGAARYSAGGYNRLGVAALATSLGLIEEIGIDTIEAHSRALADIARAELQRRPGYEVVSSPDPTHRSAIVVFTTGSSEGDAALVRHLEDRGIIVALRPLGARISPHFYNTEEEVERLLEALP